MAGSATSIDLGSRLARVLVVEVGKRGLVVKRFAAGAADEVGDLLAGSGIPCKNVVAGLSGRAMNIRPTQVPPSPDWQLRNLMNLEIQDLASQSGGELSADYNLLAIEDEEGGMETVVLALARNDALDGIAASVGMGDANVGGYVPNCVALYNAYMRAGPVEEDATVCLANIGHETIDLAIVRGMDLLFIRNLAQGVKVFDDAIAAGFNVSARKAESLKKELLDIDPASRGRYVSGQAEKVTVAAGGAGSMIVSAIQSSLQFCRAQTGQPDLQLDRVLISGGGSRVRGMEGMLREGLKVPVAVFDPFENCDLAKLPQHEYDALDAMRREAVVALGLAVGKADPALYQLEILPEAVKRRRKLLQETVWIAGAVAVAALLLVMTYLSDSEAIDTATTANRRLLAQENRLKSIHSDAEQLIQENEQLSQLVGDLAERAVPLDGVALTLRALQHTMPDEFWLTELRTERGVMRGERSRRGSMNRRTLVVVKGSGKDVSGAGVVDPYRTFLTAFKQYPFGDHRPEMQVTQESDNLGNMTFEWVIDFRPPQPATKED